MMQDYVVLVNENDSEIGIEEKMRAHELGLLHRAFSVLLFNENGKMLIHQRAENKYHSAGLWTNACCSHPRPGEKIEDAGNRRLLEEMGIQTTLKSIHSFVYKVHFDNNLTEYELDHILIGNYSGNPIPNSEEVQNWKYIELDELIFEMKEKPEIYSFWFKLIVQNHLSKIISHADLK